MCWTPVFFEIGSKPLADAGLLPRKPSDIDWFGPLAIVEHALGKCFPRGYVLHEVVEGNLPKKIYKCNLGPGKHVMVEVEDSEGSENSFAIYQEMLKEVCTDHSKLQVVPASLDWLLFFKLSHRYKKDSPHFLKTMEDILLLEKLGAFIWSKASHEQTALLAEREKLTYTNKLPNLNTTSKEFFNPETVQYKYDHDSLHVAVALGSKPAYLSYKHPDKQVLCSEELFWKCSHATRIAGVYEESCVLALERSLVPGNFKTNPDKAFVMALEKVCTSITGGWFREFAYDHYYEVLSLYHTNFKGCYVQQFHKGLESGIIQPFTQSTY